MRRVQVLLGEETFEALRQRAFREHKSLAGLLRELINKEMGLGARPKRLSLNDFRFIGAGNSCQTSLEPVSEKHDQVLEGVFRQ